MEESWKRAVSCGKEETRRLALAVMCLSKLSDNIAVFWSGNHFMICASSTNAATTAITFPEAFFATFDVPEIEEQYVDSKMFCSAFKWYRNANGCTLFTSTEVLEYSKDGTPVVKERFGIRLEMDTPQYTRTTELTINDTYNPVELPYDKAREEYIGTAELCVSTLSRALGAALHPSATFLLAEAVTADVQAGLAELVRATPNKWQNSQVLCEVPLLQIQTCQVAEDSVSTGPKPLMTVVALTPPDLREFACPPLTYSGERNDILGPGDEKSYSTDANGLLHMKLILALMNRVCGPGMRMELLFPLDGDSIVLCNDFISTKDVQSIHGLSETHAGFHVATFARIQREIDPAANGSPMADRINAIKAARELLNVNGAQPHSGHGQDRPAASCGGGTDYAHLQEHQYN